ncbi:TM2 domain-containing protein [Roseomonas populi]|uniref:TM2 domain-containing protein n=1 Tax=Roseomonas populi TaxID=3121582 RepID=A0ABT1WZY5_9PROT|nr:TM2 domain-containing protein [Roseomonas pecuniae]MCR0981039.1 TM2 domain-containing protein [Roseomonas pecuniae]
MSGRIPNSGNTGLSDAAAMMHYDANKRSVLVAYVLWFFLGWFAAHRFYAGRMGSGLVMLVVSLVSWALTAVAIGYVGLFLIGLWLLVDAFLIPGMIRSYNRGIIASLGR